jgi:hypothetical protein
VEVLSFGALFLLLVYVCISFFLRIGKISSSDKIAILMYIAISIAFYAIYFYNLYGFNDGQSISYGSDSTFFENILKSMGENGFESDSYRFIESEKKGLALFIFYPIYLLSDNYVFNAAVIFSINYFVYILTLVSIFNLLNQTNAASKSPHLKYILFLVVPAPLVIFSFLRDVYVLFFIIEIIYAYILIKPKAIKLIVIGLSLLALLTLREFYAYMLILFIIFDWLNRYSYKIKVLTLFLGTILILLLIEREFVIGLVGKLLILTDSDIHMAKVQSSTVDIEKFYYGAYKDIELIYFLLMRLVEGAYRFVLTPVFSPYLIYYTFNQVEMHSVYTGFEIKFINILYAFMHNFLLFPLLVSMIFSFKANRKCFNKVQEKVTNILLLLLITTILIYSIKFFGARNIKVDFIYSFLAIVLLMYFRINKTYYIYGVFFMIIVNLATIIRGI